MASEVHVGDIGTVIQVTLQDAGTAIDISGASTKSILVLKPDGTEVTWTAEFVTDGSDGAIKYTTASGDLNVAGVWYLQPQIVFASGVSFAAASQHLLVHPTVG